MRLAELAGLYLVIGFGCAAAVLARRRGRALLDAGLLVPFWPLLGPFLVLRGAEPGVPSRADATFIQALERASQTPLGALLPTPATIRLLADRLAVATAKVAEIDGLLARPDFDATRATDHLRELERRGASECALASARLRLQNVRRLVALRDRFAHELEDVEELLAQLRTQVEVVRLAGSTRPDGPTADLLHELLARVEGLDEVLDDGLHPEDASHGT